MQTVVSGEHSKQLNAPGWLFEYLEHIALSMATQ